MKWLSLWLDTARDGLEPLQAMLAALGVDSIEIEDEEDFNSFLENNEKYWDYVDEDLRREKAGKCRIRFYTTDDEDGFTLVARVRMAMEDVKREHPNEDLDPMILTLEHVEDTQWENNWKQYYQPIEIGERLLIVPEWLEEETADTTRTPLVLDPGLAFGTGSHATTRMCLQQLDKRVSGGERVLDLGCGSGILSIAALRLGAKSATACDVDEKAADVAVENAALNHIGADRYTVYHGDILTDKALQGRIGGGYDIVLANIVADVIIALAPHVGKMLAPGGVFLCSGIIDARAVEVADKLKAAGLRILETTTEDGWYAFAAEM
jgi:ribosomal protein L11 methyltransferase